MINTEKINRYKYYYALMDFLVLSVSFVFTVYAMMMINNINADKLMTPVFPFIIFLFMLSIMFIFDFNQLYTEEIIRSRSKQLAAVLKSLAAGSFYIFLITLAIMSVDLTEVGILVLAFSAVAFSLLYVIRIELLRAFILEETVAVKNILIIGDGYPGRKIMEQLLNQQHSNLVLTGVLDENYDIGQEVIAGAPVLGRIHDIDSVINSRQIDEVIISFDNISYNELFDLTDRCGSLNLKTKIASDMIKIIPDHFKTARYFGIPLVEISNLRKSSALKRFFDVSLSAIGLILLLPFLLIIALVIKLTSKGPVLYKHSRVGLNGKTFEFYKFRSMIVSDEDDPVRKEMMLKFMKEGLTQDESTKILNKKRLTPIGSFLRKYSIDELPQLVNVLKGDMSLVGPRPSLPYEYENYEPWQRRRVSVIPGCTGVWQITGRSLVSFDESVLLDLYYIYRCSTLFDLGIILKTIPVILFSKGGK